MSEILFPGREERNPDALTRADIAVGILGGDPPEVLEHKRRQVGRGLREFFPDTNCVVILSEDRSAGSAGEAFFRGPVEVPGILLSTPAGVTGKGNKVLNFLARARELGAESLAVVGRGPEDPSGNWVHSLLEPVRKEFSLVSPLYARPPGQGSLTGNIVYPLLRCLFGKRVREPMGGDFALAGSLADLLLKDPPDGCVRGYGIDVWMTTLAVASGVPVCQAFLGGAAACREDGPVPEPLSVFSDTVETLFSCMQRTHDLWKNVRWSKPTVVFGAGGKADPVGAPQPAEPAALYRAFQEAFPRYEALWRRILHQDVFDKLREVRKAPLETFEFPALMWTLSLFAFALAYKAGTVDAETLTQCLLALYLGRTCSTTLSTAHMGPQQTEVYLEDQCRVFEETKPYLEYLWGKR